MVKEKYISFKPRQGFKEGFSGEDDGVGGGGDSSGVGSDDAVPGTSAPSTPLPVNADNLTNDINKNFNDVRIQDLLILVISVFIGFLINLFFSANILQFWFGSKVGSEYPFNKYLSLNEMFTYINKPPELGLRPSINTEKKSDECDTETNVLTSNLKVDNIKKFLFNIFFTFPNYFMYKGIKFILKYVYNITDEEKETASDANKAKSDKGQNLIHIYLTLFIFIFILSYIFVVIIHAIFLGFSNNFGENDKYAWAWSLLYFSIIGPIYNLFTFLTSKLIHLISLNKSKNPSNYSDYLNFKNYFIYNSDSNKTIQSEFSYLKLFHAKDLMAIPHSLDVLGLIILLIPGINYILQLCIIGNSYCNESNAYKKYTDIYIKKPKNVYDSNILNELKSMPNDKDSIFTANTDDNDKLRIDNIEKIYLNSINKSVLFIFGLFSAIVYALNWREPGGGFRFPLYRDIITRFTYGSFIWAYIIAFIIVLVVGIYKLPQIFLLLNKDKESDNKINYEITNVGVESLAMELAKYIFKIPMFLLIFLFSCNTYSIEYLNKWLKSENLSHVYSYFNINSISEWTISKVFKSFYFIWFPFIFLLGFIILLGMRLIATIYVCLQNLYKLFAQNKKNLETEQDDTQDDTHGERLDYKFIEEGIRNITKDGSSSNHWLVKFTILIFNSIIYFPILVIIFFTTIFLSLLNIFLQFFSFIFLPIFYLFTNPQYLGNFLTKIGCNLNIHILSFGWSVIMALIISKNNYKKPLVTTYTFNAMIVTMSIYYIYRIFFIK